MTHRAIIVDDERFARVALADLLAERGDVVVVGEASSVAQAVTLLREHEPDLVFLDIRIREESGFHLFEQADVRAHVVFVTAYADHALRAFEVDALDYLVKPVQRRDLDRALAKATSREPGAGRVTWPPSVIPPPSAARATAALRLSDRVCLQRGKDIVFARVEDFIFLRADRDYTEVHLASGRVQRVKEPLQGWEGRLPDPPFLRIHRSILVNATHLETLSQDGEGWKVALSSFDASLPVSRRLLPKLRRRLA